MWLIQIWHLTKLDSIKQHQKSMPTHRIQQPWIISDKRLPVCRLVDRCKVASSRSCTSIQQPVQQILAGGLSDRFGRHDLISVSEKYQIELLSWVYSQKK